MPVDEPAIVKDRARPRRPPASPDDPRPLFRGRLHQGAFIASIPAGMALVAIASSALARVAATVYALSLVGLYGTSAAFHRLQWQPRSWRWMRRFDHSMIFVLIAGTYTPLSLLVLDGPWSTVMLSLVWGLAVLGITLKMARIDRFELFGGILYLVLGWLAIAALPQLLRNLSGPALGLMLAGGILYTVGAIMFALRKPNPNPLVFGYHEVWHSMVVGASVCHYVLVLMIILGAS